MKKRILSLALVLLLAFALLPFGAFAADEFDFSAYTDTIRTFMNGKRGDIYGAFADFDQDGTPELILAGNDGLNGRIEVSSVGSDFEWKTYFNPAREEAVFAVVEYSDGSYGFLMDNSSRYGDYAGKDAQGREYYWSTSGLFRYKIEDGKVQGVSEARSYGAESKPDQDGKIYYALDNRSYYIDSIPCSKEEFDHWHEINVNSAVILTVLSPWHYVGGLTGAELLGLAQTGFYDVPVDVYYADPVKWAAEKGITNGTAPYTFSPENPCTRGQVVTFLWRTSGSPEPKRADNPFVDVKPSDYFYKAVLWAAEQEITNGMDPTHFGPNGACTRAHVVTFLWRAHEKPAAGVNNPFVDVPTGQYYTDAVLWAVSKNITNGMDETHFGPDSPCIRGQIVTFLYRDLAK